MQELIWLLQPLRIWIDGGSWAEISAAPGFVALMLLGAALIPSSLIAWGIGTASWRETPLAQWFGVAKRDPDADWAERARDIDKDGYPDF